eukprot:jgi/Ulvmu1/11891/UM081_0049.1
MLTMAENSSMPQWKGLFDWSMSYHDGTKPTDFNSIELNPQKIEWLEHVLSNYMVDFSKRMEDMMEGLQEATAEDSAPDDVRHAVQLLEELHDIVESIDFARDLKSIGGLPVLKQLLRCGAPDLRWRSADVLAACAQNNLPVQEWFLSEGVLDENLPLLSSSENMVRLKGLHLASSMVRGHPSALVAFCKQPQAISSVLSLMADEDLRTRRKAIEFARRLCSDVPSLRPALAVVPNCLSRLASNLVHNDEMIRCSSIGLLRELVDDQQTLGALKADEKVVLAFSTSWKLMQTLTGEEKDAVLEEIAMAGEIADHLGL